MSNPPTSAIDMLSSIPGISIVRDEPLARHTTMGVGGAAKLFVTVDESDAIDPCIAALNGGSTPWMILGGGSNTIFTDAGWPGVVLMLGKGFRRIVRVQTNQIRAGAAAPLTAVMNFAKREGLAGLEWAAGVPGQLGGALAGNAGTPAGDICSAVDLVEVISREGARKTLRRGEFQFGYRHSSLREWIILEAMLTFSPDSVEAIQKRIDAALAKRMQQPVGQHCSGCMFKNPPGAPAGKLIDEAGLKGLKIGGARVSDQHANFMINDGTATAGEIEELIDRVREAVARRTGINLELEIKLIKKT